MSGPPARCPACGAPLAERQRWCLSCGAAASTFAAAAHWAARGLAAALVAALALAGTGYVLAALISS